MNNEERALLRILVGYDEVLRYEGLHLQPEDAQLRWISACERARAILDVPYVGEAWCMRAEPDRLCHVLLTVMLPDGTDGAVTAMDWDSKRITRYPIRGWHALMRVAE